MINPIGPLLVMCACVCYYTHHSLKKGCENLKTTPKCLGSKWATTNNIWGAPKVYCCFWVSCDFGSLLFFLDSFATSSWLGVVWNVNKSSKLVLLVYVAGCSCCCCHASCNRPTLALVSFFYKLLFCGWFCVFFYLRFFIYFVFFCVCFQFGICGV